MKQQSQTNLVLGIGAITLAVVAGYFGLDYFSAKKPATSKTASATGDYSSVIATATENAGAAGDGNLTAEQARSIGEEVAREVATRVAQSIVDQKNGGSSTAASGSGGLSEADARRIGEEEGRRVAQEVATATVQQMMASSGGGSSASAGGGLTAAEAEQIGEAAGRRAAKQVAATTAREVVRTEFGGSAPVSSETAATPTQTADAGSPQASAGNAPPAQKAAAASDALHAWWTAPASGDFGLMYAGQPKGESAIALLFSEKPSDGALSQNVKVYDAKGTLVSGSWEAAANPNLAILRGLQPGRYTVVVEPALADANGKAVNRAQHGPVYVI